MLRTLIFAIVFLLLDQGSKYYVVSVLELPSIGSIEISPPYLELSYGLNDGINFGWFAGGSDLFRYFLIAFALGVSLFLILWSRKFSGIYAHLLIGLTIGGALGNVLDRIRIGAVVDFINMSCCGLNNRSIFNLADVFVVIGILGIVFFSERFALRR